MKSQNQLAKYASGVGDLKELDLTTLGKRWSQSGSSFIQEEMQSNMGGGKKAMLMESHPKIIRKKKLREDQIKCFI